MHPPGAGTVLVRYGEVGLKSDQVRGRMEQRLEENIRSMLADRGLSGDLERVYSRLYVHTTSDEIEAVTEAVTDTFGVVSASQTRRVDPTMESICDALAETATEHVTAGTFAVRARRAGPESAHPFSSTDLERKGGAAVFEAAEAAGFDPTVDLDDPDQTFSVECRESDAYVFLERRDGPGGLPLGTQKHLVVLFSGGIDSPVAAWQVMKRGAPVIPLYVDLGEYGGVDHQMRAIETADVLQNYAPNFDCNLQIAPAGEAIEEIADATEMHRMLVVRRFMFNVAAAVAEEHGAVGIVTGESIGQKSSQTATNLQTTAAATDLPVHRPLLSMDKSEISELAREIGTYDGSTIDTGCHQLAPERPATRPRIEAVESAEPNSLDRLAEETVESTSRVD